VNKKFCLDYGGTSTYRGSNFRGSIVNKIAAVKLRRTYVPLKSLGSTT